MGFILRSAFWLSLVLMLVPLGTSDDPNHPTVGALDAFFAAREAVGDLSGLCERRPDVCETGGAVISTIGTRAREGARIAYEALDRSFGDGTAVQDVPAEDLSTGGIAPAEGMHKTPPRPISAP